MITEEEPCFKLCMKLMMNLPAAIKNYEYFRSHMRALDCIEMEKGRKRFSSYWLHNPTDCMILASVRVDRHGEVIGVTLRDEYTTAEYKRIQKVLK